MPLIIHFPDNRYAGRRVRQVVGLVDVVPTVMDLLGRPDLIGGARGRSLLPLVREQREPPLSEPLIYSARMNRKKYFQPWKQRRGDVNVVVRQENWKAIRNVEPDSVELYDLSQDPGEHTDLSAAHPQQVASYRAVAEKFLAQTDRESRVAPTPSRSHPDGRERPDLILIVSIPCVPTGSELTATPAASRRRSTRWRTRG